MEGGLQIRDLKFQNLALVAKMLWNLVSQNPSWCSKVIWNKYVKGARLRCLDFPKFNQGSPISSLCKKAFLGFKEDLFWIPGNGKLIKLWKDSVMGKSCPPNIPKLVGWTGYPNDLGHVSMEQQDPPQVEQLEPARLS